MSVVIVTWGLKTEDLEGSIGEPATLARKIGGHVRLAILGSAPQAAAHVAGRFGVSKIDRLGAGVLDEFRPDAYVAALAEYAKRVTPRAWIFAQTFDSRLVVPRLAGRLGIGCAMNVMDVVLEGGAPLATCAAFGGDTRVVYRLSASEPVIFSLNPNAVVPAPVSDDGVVEMEDVAIDVSTVKERIRLVERPEAAVGPRLEHAQIVVAGGRGLSTKENFRLVEELAAALGGMAGASRPIVDDGWAKPAQQVGLTGKITKPGLYIAAGISGASQHVVGCSAAKRLVAINTDSSAAIFRYAHYGVVGNCLEILPALAEAARKSK
jgi:electron transfer flavoprotein alpha subunit